MSAPPPLRLPSNLVEASARDGKRPWLETLPAHVASCVERWSLALGPPFEPGGQTAWVAPAGDDLVLKVGWRHFEAEIRGDGGLPSTPSPTSATSPTTPCSTSSTPPTASPPIPTP